MRFQQSWENSGNPGFNSCSHVTHLTVCEAVPVFPFARKLAKAEGCCPWRPRDDFFAMMGSERRDFLKVRGWPACSGSPVSCPELLLRQSPRAAERVRGGQGGSRLIISCFFPRPGASTIRHVSTLKPTPPPRVSGRVPADRHAPVRPVPVQVFQHAAPARPPAHNASSSPDPLVPATTTPKAHRRGPTLYLLTGLLHPLPAGSTLACRPNNQKGPSYGSIHCPQAGPAGPVPAPPTSAGPGCTRSAGGPLPGLVGQRRRHRGRTPTRRGLFAVPPTGVGSVPPPRDPPARPSSANRAGLLARLSTLPGRAPRGRGEPPQRAGGQLPFQQKGRFD